MVSERVPRLLSLEQRTQLRGAHPRRSQPAPGCSYVAGVWLPPTASPASAGALYPPGLHREPATVTIGEMDLDAPQPALRVVAHERWGPGGPPEAVRLGALAGSWNCRRIAVGTAGAGRGLDPLAQAQRDGSPAASAPLTRVEFHRLEGPAKARIGIALLQAISAGRVKAPARDPSPEAAEFWAQMVKAQARTGPDDAFDFFVPSGTGGDGFLMGLALAVEAARSLLAPSQGRLAQLLCA